MGLLQDIQSDAISQGASVSSLLRKCLLLADKIDSSLLEEWVRHELNGYPSEVPVPDYRQMAMSFKAHFIGPLGAQLRNAPVAAAIVEKLTGNDTLSTFEARQAITTIVDSDAIRNSGTMTVNLDNIGAYLGTRLIQHYTVAQFWGEVPAMSVVGIVEAVKTRTLEFTMALSKKYPIASEIGALEVRDAETERQVSQIFQNTIYGPVGIMGVAQNSTVAVAVGAGSWSELGALLRDNGVTESDLISLKFALEEEREPPKEGTFGPRVTKWIGGMVTKAASGAWGIGLSAAGTLLQEALLSYYGLRK